MRTLRPSRLVFIALLMVLFATAAHAQATRTWVSGVGDDANPCSRTAPCKTFAGAISKTATGGEISVLDPGGFGGVTITKGMTLSGDGTLASILASGFQGIVVNAPATDTVVIRNLSINGAGTTLGFNGIRFLGGKSLHVQNVTIQNFQTNGIEMTNNTVAHITNTTIINCTVGIRATTALASRAALNATNVNINACPTGVSGGTASNIALRNVTIAGSSVVGATVTGATSELNFEGGMITMSTLGLQTAGSATARISEVHFIANAKAIDNGGTVGTYQNNRFSGNVNANTGNALAPLNDQ